MIGPQKENLSFRAKRGTCFLCLALAGSLSFAQESLPDGWRNPTPPEAQGELRQKSPIKFLSLKGDFDGDGRPDLAALLVDKSGEHFALWVKVTSTGKWQLLGEPYPLKYLDRIGIDLVDPGKYETACGKGYGDYACAHGEPGGLELRHPAIDLFYSESSETFFYWDERAKGFRQALISD